MLRILILIVIDLSRRARQIFDSEPNVASNWHALPPPPTCTPRARRAKFAASISRDTVRESVVMSKHSMEQVR